MNLSQPAGPSYSQGSSQFRSPPDMVDDEEEENVLEEEDEDSDDEDDIGLSTLHGSS